jgi:anti-anti-sigma factor
VTPELPRTSELSSEIVHGEDEARLILRGELDMNGVLTVERAVAEAAAGTRKLIIDLSELRFMDLFGARALLRAAGEMNTAERKVVIANPHRHVRRLFELITDLTRHRGLEIEMVERL